MRPAEAIVRLRSSTVRLSRRSSRPTRPGSSGADHPAAVRGALEDVQPVAGEVEPVDLEQSGPVRSHQPGGQRPQRGGLAAARRAEDEQALVARQVEGHHGL